MAARLKTAVLGATGYSGLELTRLLAKHPRVDTPLQLRRDGHGARHLAEKWEKDGTLKKVKALLLMDMIGDADLNIERETNSTPWLTDLVYEAAERNGVQSHFYARAAAIEDDHLPFVKRGVPSIDIIDLDYGYNNVFHHTPQDTLDKLSPRSLEIVGNTTLEALRMLDRR